MVHEKSLDARTKSVKIVPLHNVEMYVKTVNNQKNNANVITCISITRSMSKVTKLYKLGTNARAFTAFYTKRKFSRRNVCTVESIHSTAI